MSNIRKTKNISYKSSLIIVVNIIFRNSEVLVKEEYEDTEYAHLPPFQEHDQEIDTSKVVANSKRRLRSYRVSSIDENKQLRSYEEIKQDTGNLSR